jgi:predicted nuclease with TOPRIM domain
LAQPSGESERLETVDRYEALRREHEKLESRRRTLQELKEVEDRQQALLEEMQRLRPGEPHPLVKKT